MKALLFKLTGKRSEDTKVYKQVAKLLKAGKVGVLPTDTLYGVLGRAFDKKTVAKIYRVRRREPLKPFIILISSVKDLRLFDVAISSYAASFLSRVWPAKVSVILPCGDDDLRYLHRGTHSLAFRLPDDKNLRSLLKETGPLVAPSANLEGQPEALTILEARKYFADKVDFYVDVGEKVSEPSTLIRISQGGVEVLRQGAVKIS